jgi:DNA-binding LacI/PurR family transcriptional regulator
MNKPKVRVRSVDVARLAGVSRSAVSRTFTPGTYISSSTKKKVLEAAEALGYQPNALARSLITRRTGIIGIVSTDLDNPFYAVLLQDLSRRLQSEGLAPLLLFGDETSTDRQITQLLSYQVDALVLTNATLSSAMAARCARVEKPIVAINRYLTQEEITSITCDNRGSAAAVANHLISLGCRRIAFIAGKPDASSSRDREAGFLRRLGELGHSVVAVDSGDYHHLGGVEAARRVLSGPARPDAVFCANDMMAFGVMDAARDEFGLRIPEDLKVCGFDNSTLAGWSSYNLTSVDQNVAGMIDAGVEHIIACISGERPSTRHLEIPGRLVVRESTVPHPHDTDRD